MVYRPRDPEEWFNNELQQRLDDCRRSGGRELDLNDISHERFDNRVLAEITQLVPEVRHLVIGVHSQESLDLLNRFVEFFPALEQITLFVSDDDDFLLLHQDPTHLAKVRSLNLDGIGDDGLKSLADLAEHLGGLRELGFEGCSFGDEGLSRLAEHAKRFINLERIEEYESESLEVTSEGCKALARFVGLKQLFLEGWPISDRTLAALARRAEFAPTLEELDLQYTDVGDAGLKVFSEYAERFPRLSWLSLQGLEAAGDDSLKELSLAWQRGGFRTLKSVLLQRTRVQSVADEVLETGDAKIIFESALNGLAMPEAKIVVLGEPAVGKTSLCRRLFSRKLADPSRRRETHDFEQILPAWRPTVGELEVGLRVWDFGGQHILHGTHEMFLTSRSVCLLVLDATQVVEHDPRVQDAERDGNRLSYWLKMVRHFVGADANVILVVTKSDERTHRLTPIDADRFRMEHRFLRVIQIVDGFSSSDKSLKAPVEEVRGAIANALELMSLRSRVTPQFVAVARTVENHMDGRAVAGMEEYRGWCKDVGVTGHDEQETHLRTLHNFGTVFCFGLLACDARQREQLRRPDQPPRSDEFPAGQRRLLEAERDSALQRWVINPRWLKRPLYELIRESERTAWLSEDAIRRSARRQTAGLKIDDPGAAGDVVLAMLKLTELCFFEQTRGWYFFPRGLPEESQKFLTGWDEDGRHEVVWEWDFFPEAIIHRFIVQAHRHGEVLNDAQWRTGVVLQYGDTTVAVQSTPEAGRVTLWLKKRPDNELLPTQRDQRFLDRLRHRLCELVGREPDLTNQSWDALADEASSSDQPEDHSLLPRPREVRPEEVLSGQSSGQLPGYAAAAYRAYRRAEAAVERALTDRDAHDWLKENDDADYELPDFSTWARYLRTARQLLGESKHSPRAGRSGRSIVGPDEL